MNSFSFTVLGSLAAMPSINKNQSAHILNVCEQIFLIDAAEGVQREIKRRGFNPMKINHIFISHLHGDHFYGIFGLISTMSLLGRKYKLTIYGPAPIKEAIECHCRLYEKHLKYEIECVEINHKEHALIYENKVLEVYALPLSHKVPTVGYLFNEKVPPRNINRSILDRYNLDYLDIRALKQGRDVTLPNGDILASSEATYAPYQPRSFAYLCDTTPSKEVAAMIDGVSLLYHEATFLEKDKQLAIVTQHSTTKDAAYIASLSHAKRLVVGHLSLRYKGGESEFESEVKQYFENSSVAIEGAIYQI